LLLQISARHSATSPKTQWRIKLY